MPVGYRYQWHHDNVIITWHCSPPEPGSSELCCRANRGSICSGRLAPEPATACWRVLAYHPVPLQLWLHPRWEWGRDQRWNKPTGDFKILFTFPLSLLSLLLSSLTLSPTPSLPFPLLSSPLYILLLPSSFFSPISTAAKFEMLKYLVFY